MAMTYDVTTKELIEFHPPDWLAFLGLPDAPVVVDADLATLSFEAEKVLRVDDPSGAYILHLEFQASYDANFDLRVLRYNVLLSERHELPIISVAFLLRPEAAGSGATGKVVRHFPQNLNTHEFTYLMIRVWENRTGSVSECRLGTCTFSTHCQRRQIQSAGSISKTQGKTGTDTAARTGEETADSDVYFDGTAVRAGIH